MVTGDYVKIRCNPETFDVDLAALGAAITPRTRVVIVNTPNNPTGRIYPPSLLKDLAAMLEGASRSNGRRVYLLSDEPHNRIVYDGARFHSPAEYYPYTLLAYSYGKTHLAPGQRYDHSLNGGDPLGRLQLDSWTSTPGAPQSRPTFSTKLGYQAR